MRFVFPQIDLSLPFQEQFPRNNCYNKTQTKLVHLMKKYIILFSFLIMALVSNAQFNYDIPSQKKNKIEDQKEEKKAGFTFDPNKISYGGGIGLQFGDYTLINIAPQVGYNFSNKFNAGLGFSYAYIKDEYWSDYSKWKEKNSYLGFNLYARLFPTRFTVLAVQPEINRMWRSFENMDSGEKYKDEKLIPSFVVGGGLRLGTLSFMLKYDLIQNNNSPYGTNIFYSVGFNF